jgi:mono/diheme cytochrome c family protein
MELDPMKRRRTAVSALGTAALLAASYIAASSQSPQAPTGSAQPGAAARALIDRYCITCHNDGARAAGLSLQAMDPARIADHRETWEKVVQRIRTRVMPPAGMPHPDEASYRSLQSYLEIELDRAAAAHPDPGRVKTLRRLNGTEYQNAIRDLLGLNIDSVSLLPKEDASHGFDSVNLAGLSPTLLERYLSASEKISRLAIGGAMENPESRVMVVPVELTQEEHFDGLPLGTRGGTLVDYTFSRDGEYEIQVRLQRNRNENLEGLHEPHQMEVTLDGERLQLFTVVPNRNGDGIYYSDEGVDKHLNLRVAVKAGSHKIGVTFLAKPSALIQTERQPYVARFNMNRHPRSTPAVYSIAISGPWGDTAPGNTATRRLIFSCYPARPAEEAGCARNILSALARRAYRRPVNETDVQTLLGFYKQGHAEGGFEGGIQMALRALLASTEFLVRVERDPRGLQPNTVYRIGNVELASRLSFFLWSSIPDNELLDLASAGKLNEPAMLERQVRRMLADPRSEALVTNFAGQWLYLRNLAAVSPNARQFPDFDDNLRQAFRRETELYFQSIMQEDRNVVDLLTADYTFLNQRLARHYGIPNVYGDRFRRVSLAQNSERRGLLGHGSILTVTAYATRTSPVLRGNWILGNILGVQVPPPPPNVPALEENDMTARVLSMRERMGQHRANPVCASCHNLMDPVGLATENFNAIGRWRTRDGSGATIDASGSLPGGARFDGIPGLRQALLERPELFINTVTEKLLTYALGRGLEYYDAAAVRKIRQDAARNDNRFSSIILGIVNSAPFQMRRSQ